MKRSWIGGEHSPVGDGNEMNCCFQVSFLPIMIDDSNFLPFYNVFAGEQTHTNSIHINTQVPVSWVTLQ